MFFSIFSRKKQLFIWESEIFVRLWGDVNLDKNGGLPAWRRGKAGKNWADGLREAVCLALRKRKKNGRAVCRRGGEGKCENIIPKHDSVFGIIDTDGYRANNRRCFNFSSAVAYVQYPSAMAQSQQTRYKPVKFGIVSVYARVAGENFSPEAK